MHSLDARVFATADPGGGVATSELGDDGRIRLNETWKWESRPGSGQSVEVQLR